MGGVCGTGPSFCGIGNCESGNCTQSEPPEQPEPPELDGDTPDGTCGGVDGYTCSVIFGNCCNASGQCGSDPADCTVATGCQPDFGCCDGNCPGPNGGPGEAPAFNHYGCYQYSDTLPAALDGASTTDSRYMSQQACAKFCITTGGFDYFSIDNGDSCRCGNGGPQIALPAAGFVAKDASLCDKACSGAPAQTCGGDLSLGVFDLFGTPPTPPGIMAGYKYLGCYSDLTNGLRALWEDNDLTQTMTVEACKQWCVDDRGYRYFGVEWGVECYCGNRRDETSSLVADSECGMPCTGNADQTCGDDQRLSLYGPHDTATHVYLGCQTNLDPQSPTLDSELHVSPRMTNQMCSGKCISYNYFGTESGDTCWCGYEIQSSSRPLPHSQCNAPCDGDSSQKCGGHEKVSTWVRNPHGPSYIYQGCVTDEDPSWWVLGGRKSLFLFFFSFFFFVPFVLFFPWMNKNADSNSNSQNGAGRRRIQSKSVAGGACTQAMTSSPLRMETCASAVTPSRRPRPPQMRRHATWNALAIGDRCVGLTIAPACTAGSGREVCMG